MSETIDALIEELKKDPKLNQKVEQTGITEDTLTQFILDKSEKLVNSGLLSVEEIRASIQQSVDSEEILAYADLIRATAHALEVVNKIGLQNKRTKTAEKLKKMDIEARKNLPAGGNTNILVATREEVIKTFLDKIKNSYEADTVKNDPVLTLEDTENVT